MLPGHDIQEIRRHLLIISPLKTHKVVVTRKILPLFKCACCFFRSILALQLKEAYDAMFSKAEAI